MARRYPGSRLGGEWPYSYLKVERLIGAKSRANGLATRCSLCTVAGLWIRADPSRFAGKFREQRLQLVYLLPTRTLSDGRDTQLFKELI